MTPLCQTPARWAPRIDALGALLRGQYAGERHHLSLRLAGALVERDIPTNAVPAITHDLALAAGWDPTAAHRNALDTVNKHAAAMPIRSDIPPRLTAAVDAFADVVSTPTADLADEQHKLHRAIADTPRGRVTAVRAPCGLGKTYSTIRVATERASRGKRTVISVPTNELAEQVTADLRARGVATRRVFGPASDARCQYQGQAQALAKGGLSVRWELCEGRGGSPCPYRKSCPAADGVDGPNDADVIVGNHGLLPELVASTTKDGMLVIDEPPEVLKDLPLRAVTLDSAKAALQLFEDVTIEGMLPAIAVARAHLDQASLNEPGQLADVTPEVNGLDDLLEAANEYNITDAAKAAFVRGAPLVQRRHVNEARGYLPTARQIGDAAETMRRLRWALVQAGVTTTCTQKYGSDERLLNVTGLHVPLADALRSESRVVVMAADVHLYMEHYRRLLGYDPLYVACSAPDGCAVRRVLIEVKAATRTQWIARNKPPTTTLQYALQVAREAGPKVAIVTFYGLVPWVQLQAPGVEVRYYNKLRGLDRWKDYDALITLGDPWLPPDTAKRMGLDSEKAARAELEQAHGRLRVVHRTKPCTMVHVGALVPYGWRDPIEVHKAPSGRPARASVDVGQLRACVEALGGVRAAARAVKMSPASVTQWLKGRRVPSDEVVQLLQQRASVADKRYGASEVFT